MNQVTYGYTASQLKSEVEKYLNKPISLSTFRNMRIKANVNAKRTYNEGDLKKLIDLIDRPIAGYTTENFNQVLKLRYGNKTNQTLSRYRRQAFIESKKLYTEEDLKQAIKYLDLFKQYGSAYARKKLSEDF